MSFSVICYIHVSSNSCIPKKQSVNNYLFENAEHNRLSVYDQSKNYKSTLILYHNISHVHISIHLYVNKTQPLCTAVEISIL